MRDARVKAEQKAGRRKASAGKGEDEVVSEELVPA
jgi:hypothetical protein